MDPEPSLSLLLFSENTTIISGFILLFILLLCSALISGAEVALFSLTRTDIDQGLEENSKSMGILDKLLRQPKKLLATILVTNNFLNIAIVLLFASISDSLLRNIDYSINFYLFSVKLVFFIKVILATFLILLFGEIIPKIYASRNKVTFSSFMARPLQILDTLFTPISFPMRLFTDSIERKLGKQKSNLSVDQLSQALELTDSGDTTDDEQKILEGIVSFGNTETKQVMKPRLDIFALSSDSGFEDIIPEIIKNGYSRIPVFEESLDNITGILYSKDLLPHINKKTFDWISLIREPFFVPENKKLDDLMVDFQTKKVHLAVVVDEYGGTSGIISLEDVIEEIVGDISDEFDDDDVIYSKIDEKNYSFEGKTTLKDFYRILNLEDDLDFEEKKGEAETIAGFVLEISGTFPRVGSKINFKKYVFTVEALEKKRLKQIKLTILD